MAKGKIQFVCNECGSAQPKWLGQCPDCGTWNSLQEFKTKTTAKNIKLDKATISVLNNINTVSESRFSTGIKELDRTLGGGLVDGSVVLLGGDPGIGKSTLILQCLQNINKNYKVLYVSGEESVTQISQRAKRLDINEDILLLTEIDIDNIITISNEIKPKVVVIDSIQTMISVNSNSTAGSVSQVRECASQLTTFAKHTNTVLFLIGHVTKDGAIAGPRILEHMVDTVLYFEGDSAGRYRLVRAVKNRFGAVNELSVFAMTKKGLKQVENPSAIFLANQKPSSGSVITIIREGTKPLLLEIQALVDQTAGNFKRVCVGLEQNRLLLQLAILHKHTGIITTDQDVFINIVGGVKTIDTAIDLAVMLAIVSSLSNKVIDNKTVIFGEVGLTGEIRPVYNGEERLIEALKHGFTTAIIPTANKPKKKIKGINIFAINSLADALVLI